MNLTGGQHRTSVVAVCGIALAALLALVIFVQVRPQVDRLSAMEFVPIDLLGAVEGLDRSQDLLVLPT